MSRFVNLSDAGNLYSEMEGYSSIIFWKPVQSGKTGDILKLIQATHQDSYTIFVSDKNTVLAQQTNNRTRTMGFTVSNYTDLSNFDLYAWFYQSPLPSKKVLHFLMEVNNLQSLYDCLMQNTDIPVTLIIDEGDKCRNTTKESDEEEEEDTLPPISRKLLEIKNLLKGRANSRTVFVTATPQGLLVSEKDNWLVVYKQPYANYVGVGLEHPFNGRLRAVAPTLSTKCKARDRWTGNYEDTVLNTNRRLVAEAIQHFISLPSGEDESITQLMLVSLENHNAPQERLVSFIQQVLLHLKDDSAATVLLNGNTKDKEDSLASMISLHRMVHNKSKLIVVAGFMASRGVSFTDYSDKSNQYELVSQVHHTKNSTPINSAMQAMRIFGPARRTVSRPTLWCNDLCGEDIENNFASAYRVVVDIANGEKHILTGEYDNRRALSQRYNFRYYRYTAARGATFFLEVSDNMSDHEPIEPVKFWQSKIQRLSAPEVDIEVEFDFDLGLTSDEPTPSNSDIEVEFDLD